VVLYLSSDREEHEAFIIGIFDAMCMRRGNGDEITGGYVKPIIADKHLPFSFQKEIKLFPVSVFVWGELPTRFEPRIVHCRYIALMVSMRRDKAFHLRCSLMGGFCWDGINIFNRMSHIDCRYRVMRESGYCLTVIIIYGNYVLYICAYYILSRLRLCSGLDTYTYCLLRSDHIHRMR